MNVFKTAGKVVGTAVLTVTGVASSVVKTCADSTGSEFWSSLSGSAKDASFNSIKKMWKKQKTKKIIANVDKSTEKVTLMNARDGYLNRAKAAEKMAILAEQQGNEAKKNEYRSEYDRCMNKYKSLDRQYQNAVKRNMR